jgi:fatty acid synthase subunit alpha, fungi type
MVRLMFVKHETRWFNGSLKNLIGDWLRNVEERFAGVNGGGDKPLCFKAFLCSMIPSLSSINFSRHTQTTSRVGGYGIFF